MHVADAKARENMSERLTIGQFWFYFWLVHKVAEVVFGQSCSVKKRMQNQLLFDILK